MGQGPRVAIIGASSLSHGKRLVDDLLGVRELAGGRIALMGIHLQRLEVVGRYAKRSAAVLQPSLDVLVTTDLRRALEGAQLVFALFDSGGFAAFDLDWRIALRYRLDICIGDTVGPLGILRALRNGPVMLALAEAMAAICPAALLVNYVNPRAPMVAAAAARGIDCVGVCGGIEATRAYVAGVLGLDAVDLRTAFAGVNHLAWLLELGGPDGDLYPRFRELMRDPQIRGGEAARFEMLQQFGYFATESSGHISDFFPYFRRSEELRKRYCSGSGYSGASGAYHKLASFAQRRLGDADYLEGEEPTGTRSPDYGPLIAEAVLGGRSRRFNGNVMNAYGARAAAIPGLPASACVELPLVLEGRRVIVPPAPPLPPALAALCTPSALQAGLVLEALQAEDPELVFAAIALDGPTSAVLDLPAMRSLSAELLASNAAWLPAGLALPLRATVDASIFSSSKLVGGRGSEDPIISMVKNYERRRREGKAGSARNPGS
jgi:alpha-galactosidase